MKAKEIPSKYSHSPGTFFGLFYAEGKPVQTLWGLKKLFIIFKVDRQIYVVVPDWTGHWYHYRYGARLYYLCNYCDAVWKKMKKMMNT